MQYAYLGFTDMLQKILTTLFDEILSPVITSVFNVLVKLLGGLLWELFCDLFMDGFVILLKCINFLESIFNLFAGLGVVYYKGKGTNLLSMVFELDGISKVLGLVTVMAAAVAFILALYATGRSISDSALGTGGKPVTYVLKSALKSMVTFMLVPVMCVFLLQLSSTLLDRTIYVFTTEEVSGDMAGSSGMDDMLFVTAAQGAAKNPSAVRDFSKGHKYSNRSEVRKHFHLDRVDYLIGYVSCVLVILIMLGSCLGFIRRIFELLLLYLVSPFFSATIVLDDGARFAKWRELFVAKFFTGFGAIFAMKLYLLVIPIISGSSLTFSGNASTDRYIKMFLIIGGAWAVYKGQHTMLQMLSPDAAAAASQTSGAMVALAMGGMGKAARGAVGGARTVAKAYKEGKAGSSHSSGKGGSASSDSGQSQAYRG